LNITPAPNQAGSTVITVWVLDGEFGGTSNSFVLLVNPVNQPPTISHIPDQSISEDAPATVILFTIDDVETAAGNLIVSARSSNQALIPDANLRLGGSGTSRALLLTPAANENGAATITLTVSDGATNLSTTFLVTVAAANDLPNISAIPAQSFPEDTVAEIPFTVSDLESSPDNLIFSAMSSNPALVAPENIVFSGSGSNWVLRILPLTNQFGRATITLSVTDEAGGTASESFVFSVTPVNDPPTLDPIANLSLTENASTQIVPLSGITSGAANENQTLLITADSSDGTLVIPPSISYSSPDPTGTLSLTPVPGAHGSAVISVIVNDGQSENSLLVRTFTVTIAAAPTVITQAVRVNATTTRILFTTVAGQDYTLEYTSSLASTEWIPLVRLTGRGEPQVFEDTQADDSMRFYRIRVE
jgi:hypothetical protein